MAHQQNCSAIPTELCHSNPLKIPRFPWCHWKASFEGIIWRECHCSCTNEGRNYSENFHFYHLLWEVKKKNHSNKGLTWMQWPQTVSAVVAVREIIFLVCALNASKRKRQGLPDDTVLLLFLLQRGAMLSDVSPKEVRGSGSGARWSCSQVARNQSAMIPPP